MDMIASMYQKDLSSRAVCSSICVGMVPRFPKLHHLAIQLGVSVNAAEFNDSIVRTSQALRGLATPATLDRLEIIFGLWQSFETYQISSSHSEA